MSGDPREVRVRRQQCELVADAERGQERVDRPDLHAAAPATVTDLRRSNVVRAIGKEERQRREALDDAVALPWPMKALE